MSETKPAQKSEATFNYRLPSDVTMKHAAKLSIVDDKPIMMDYWTASLDKKALIGAKENGEKLLVKSEDEYTSTMRSLQVSTEYMYTENSIYLYLMKFLPERFLKFKLLK